MSELIPHDFKAISTRFAGASAEDDLSSGIQSSFGIVGYKGKVWSIRYRGEELQLMREDGDGPKSSIEVVLLKASKTISKVWYAEGYVEGSNAAPDCFSNNGVTPEPTSANKQCDSCAICPHNQWGSRITPAGKAGKACSDSKRVAVAPLSDLNNEAFGGPMLLRVPAASLQDLALFGQKMQQLGYPYYSIGTRIQFDPSESFPKFKFNAIRPLSDEEADVVLGIRDNHTVERILSENEFAPAKDEAPAVADVSSAFEQPPAEDKPAAKPAAKATAKPAAKAEAKPADDAAAKKAAALAAKRAELEALEAQLAAQEQEAEPEESDEDRELRELEAKMAAMKAMKAEAKPAAKPAAKVEAKAETIETSSDDGNMVSDFEANLDKMIGELLPSA